MFVCLTVNCKSWNFHSVDTLSAQLHCHMDYFIYWRHAKVHTCRTADLHAILSFLVSLFASYDPQSHKILQFYCFQISLSKKVGAPCSPCPPPRPPGFAAPVLRWRCNLHVLNSVIEESKYCSEVMKKHFNKEFVMTKEDNEDFKNSTKCWICDNDYIDNYIKVKIIVISLENIEALHREIVISILN